MERIYFAKINDETHTFKSDIERLLFVNYMKGIHPNLSIVQWQVILV